MTTRRKAMTIDVTDYMKQVYAGAGLPCGSERFILPVSMWRKMKRLLRLDDYIQDNEDNQDADRPDDKTA